MPNDTRTPNPTLALLQGMKNGLPNLPATVTGITVLNQTYTIATFGTALDGYIAPYAAAETAEQARDKALEVRKPLEAQTETFVGACVSAFKGAFGKTSANLEIVGIEPDKVPPPPTVAQKAERVAKAKATRAARGTLGPKQKAAIHGTVPAASTTGTTTTGTTATGTTATGTTAGATTAVSTTTTGH